MLTSTLTHIQHILEENLLRLKIENEVDLDTYLPVETDERLTIYDHISDEDLDQVLLKASKQGLFNDRTLGLLERVLQSFLLVPSH